MASHHFALSGQPEPEWSGGSFGGLGVLVFFALSGYLVAGSWARDPRIAPFALKRLLRIWPGLAVVVLLSVLVLGPAVSTLDTRAYFQTASTWRYLFNLDLVHFEWSLPGVFTQGEPSSAVNGSLWTIPIEIRCYLLLAALGVMGLLRRRLAYLLLYGLAAFAFLCLTRVFDVPVDRMRVQLGMVFFGAAALQMFEAHWMRWRNLLLAAVVAIAAWVWNSIYREAALTLALPITVIVLGMAATPVLSRFGRFGDFSYGMYVYAFPVQQTVLWLAGGRLSMAESFGLSFVATLGLAALSWHLVEKNALRWKPSGVRHLPEPATAEARRHSRQVTAELSRSR